MTRYAVATVGMWLLFGIVPPGPAKGEVTGGVVKIGVLNDQSGPYADTAGRGTVEAARMAIADFGGTVKGKPIVLLDADHQNKPDIGLTIARRWYDVEGVDLILDVGNSAIALAINQLSREKNKAMVVSSVGTSALTGAECTPNEIQWSYNNYALSRALSRALIDAGKKTWFFLTVDYAFGQSLEKEATAAITQFGGRVVGTVRYPLNAPDFSSQILTAQSSQADVIALASAGSDVVNAVKQSREFGLTTGKQTLAALLMQISETHGIGQEAAEGLYVASGFEWNLDDKKEAWSKRFFEKTGRMPTMVQAGAYSATLHYLRAVERSDADTGREIIDAMKAAPVDDFFAGGGRIRDDGQLIHDFYVLRVKPKSQAKSAWDYYELIKTIPGDQAFVPAVESACPAINGKAASGPAR